MLLAEETDNYRINYYYDANGLVTQIGYLEKNNGTYSDERYYFFTRNGQGDIVGIYRNSDSTLVGTYEYDLWGNIVSVKENVFIDNKSKKEVTDTDRILNRNPLRYRGYYYDAETGFYYTKNRYYNPKIHRFINADKVQLLGATDDIISYNLFAYCGNNPITGYDPEGTVDIGNIFKGGWWMAVGVTAMVVGVSVLTCGVEAPAMLAIAGVTIAAGAATTVNGVSELGEAATGHNFVLENAFKNDKKAYDIYAHSTAALAEIGTLICGGWLGANAPRISAYNNMSRPTNRALEP